MEAFDQIIGQLVVGCCLCVLDVEQVAQGKAAYREEVNWVPRSDVMTALGQREVLNTILNKWVKPWDTGRGPPSLR